MSRHYDRERELQGRIEAVLAEAYPEVEVLDIELDEPHETVRVFIDRPGGVRLEHCEQVTHAIRDTCPDHGLEVSSPGIERPLRRAEHFRSVVGERVKLRREGAKRASVLRVLEVDERVGVTVAADGGEPMVVPFEQIVRSRLVVDDPFAAAGMPRGVKRKGTS